MPRSSIALACLATLLGCGAGAAATTPTSATTSAEAPLDGRWSGVAALVQYDATLTQHDTLVGGPGWVGPSPESGMKYPTLATTYSGSFVAPHVTLAFERWPGVVWTFAGELESPSLIRGVVRTDAAGSFALVLRRQ